jgi:hypothetical protein
MTSTMSGCSSWAGAMLTLTVAVDSAPGVDRHRAASARALDSTASPSSTISPDSSAAGMKLDRRHQGPVGVPDPYERLEADHLAPGSMTMGW